MPPPPNVGSSSSSSSQVPSCLRTPPPPNVGSSSSSSPQVPFSQPRPNIVRYPMNNQNISGSSSSSPQFPFPCVFPTPPNAVRYPVTSLNGFYLCRNCRNHISCWTNVIQRVPGSLQIPGVSGDAILCRDAVNVKIDKSRRWYINNLPVVCFHCGGCNTTLGEKFLVCDRLDHSIFEGNYLLHADRILEWNGSQLCHAHTHEPVEETRTLLRKQFLQGKSE
ncbi:hypothetical protein V6Z11_D03G152200 [Gossypium hirsutum]